MYVVCHMAHGFAHIGLMRYRMAGNIGVELYLAIWWSSVIMPNFKSPNYSLQKFCTVGQFQSVVWDVQVAEKLRKRRRLLIGLLIPLCVLAILCMLFRSVIVLPTFGGSISIECIVILFTAFGPPPVSVNN